LFARKGSKVNRIFKIVELFKLSKITGFSTAWKALVCSPVIFIACITHAQKTGNSKILNKQFYMTTKYKYNSKSNDTCDYIKFKSGDVKRFNCSGANQSIEYKKGKMVLGKEKFPVDSIDSFTNYRWFCIINNRLPLMLLKKGKISIYGFADGKKAYFKDVERGPNYFIERSYFSLYIQVENGAITELTPEKLVSITSDNPNSQDLIDRYLRNTEKTRFIEQAIDVYNGVIYNEDDYFEARDALLR
jgi:hypothetical protein